MLLTLQALLISVLSPLASAHKRKAFRPSLSLHHDRTPLALMPCSVTG